MRIERRAEWSDDINDWVIPMSSLQAIISRFRKQRERKAKMQ